MAKQKAKRLVNTSQATDLAKQEREALRFCLALRHALPPGLTAVADFDNGVLRLVPRREGMKGARQ